MSKQDVSAVVEQDSSPVVETPALGSAAVESTRAEPLRSNSAEGESTEAGSADLATPARASAKDETRRGRRER